MSLLLTVQSDSVQATALRDLLHERVSGDVVVANSVGAALTTIDQRMPDVILIPMLMPPAEEDHLMAYLATLPAAGHVQTIRVPLLQRAAVTFPAHSRFFSRWDKSDEPMMTGCDPRAFARDVLTYLASAGILKEEIEQRSADRLGSGYNRRGESRWTRDQVPWVSVVRLAGEEQVDLMNVSSGGALLRTRSRPDRRFLQRSDPNRPQRPDLTFQLESGAEIRTTGRVVRCVSPTATTENQYEVAFCFDESISLELRIMRAVVPVGNIDALVQDHRALPAPVDAPRQIRYTRRDVTDSRW